MNEDTNRARSQHPQVAGAWEKQDAQVTLTYANFPQAVAISLAKLNVLLRYGRYFLLEGELWS